MLDSLMKLFFETYKFRSFVKEATFQKPRESFMHWLTSDKQISKFSAVV